MNRLFGKTKISKHIGLLKEKTGSWNRYFKFFPAVAFISGFTWDSFTLTRIDSLSDNLIMLLYLLLLGGSIVLVNSGDLIEKKDSILLKYKKWYPSVIQFLLGGLFSGYVVYYFKSATFSRTSIFLVILVFLLVINEFLERRLTNLYLQLSLFYFVNFSFFIFFTPILIKRMDGFSFFTGGLISLVTAAGLIFILLKLGVFERAREFIICQSIPIGLFLLFSAFYVFNWIPPVPLSVHSAGIYHHIEKETAKSGKTVYILQYEKPPWYKPWVRSESEFNYRQNDKVYCFSSIFAPREIKEKIFHYWLQRDAPSGKWIERDKILFEIIGGRSDGFRGFTFKKNVFPGQWKVDIKTNEGLLLGRIKFAIVKSDSDSLVFTQIKQ